MKRILDNLLAKWNALAPQRRIVLAAVVATVLIGAYVVVTKVNQVTWAVLYANVDDATASEVLASLDGKGIQYKLDGNGTRILVPAGDLNTTRIALANEGISGQAVPDGFAEIFDNQGLSTTDFAQKVNYERALEGELARTLLSMEAVSGASVQLSIPERSIFVGRQSAETDKPTGSVLLQLKRPMTASEVDTVVNLISSSVPGLTAQQLTVAATDGTLLKAAGDAAMASGSSSLELAQNYESRLQDQLTALVRGIPGAQNATVTVSAELSFSNSTTQRESIDPTNNAVVAEHTVTEDFAGTGVVPGGEVGVDGGPLGGASGGDSTYTKSDTTTQTQVGERTVTETNDSTPVVKRLGIAVVIPAAASMVEALDADAIKSLVSAAANVNDERADLVEVAVVPLAAAVAADGTDAGAGNGLVTEPVLDPGGVSPYMIIVGFAIGALGVVILGRVRRKRKAKKAAMLLAAEKLTALGADPKLAHYLNFANEDSDGAGKGKKGKKKKKSEASDAMPTMMVPRQEEDKAAMDEIRGDLEKLLAESPDSLAGLLSNWMTK